MNWANYLIQINLYLVLFYAFYLLFLKNETFFNLNRTYLVGSAFFSILIPLVRADWVKDLFITEKVQTGWVNANVIVMQGFANPLTENSDWVIGDYLTFAYLAVLSALFLRLIVKLFKLSRLLKSESPSEAYSFFNKIKINPTLPHQNQIEKHELTHAKNLHSADVIFFEILFIVNWFNPIGYLYKKSVRHIHEFIADEEAVKLNQDKKEYALLLFSKSFGIQPNQLTNNFFNQSLLKRRIKMLQKPKSRKTAILKYGLSVPLFLLSIILSSAKISENKTIDKIAEAVKPKQTIAEIIAPKAIVELVSKPVKKQINIDKEGDFVAFKKYLAKTVRYPNEAREIELTGRVLLEFVVNIEGIITSANATTMKNNALGKESINAVNSYKEKLNVEAGTYTIVIDYQIKGNNTIASQETEEFGLIKNYIGQLLVTAYSKDISLMVNEVRLRDTTKNEDPIYQNVEVLPRFPGGLSAFSIFLADNLKYPTKAKQEKIEGRVYVQLVVEKDGSVSNIKAIRGIGYGCDEEAVRVLALSPKWNPGMQKGEKVRVGYTIPILFKLDKPDLPPPPPPAPSYPNTPPPPPSVDINSKNKALFIIDGIEFKGDKNKLNEDLNPDKIQSINVLKGESAIKKYGEKGKDGVIEITTKKKEK